MFLKLNAHTNYLKCQSQLFPVLVEMGRTSELKTLNSQTNYQVRTHKIQPSAPLLYTQALFYFLNGDLTACDYHLEESLKMSLQDDHKENICNALFGQARLYFAKGNIEDTLKKIKTLEIFFDVIPVPDVQISTYFLMTELNIRNSNYSKALDLVWKSHDILKSNPNPFFRSYLFVNFALCYFHLGNIDLAQHNIKLSKQAIRPEEHINSLKTIQRAEKIIGATRPEFDLVLNKQALSIHEKSLGDVPIRNQFILIEMLNLFALNQGQVFSKEQLAEKIWDQRYDAGVHDNKIYVTIKRLRQLIEPKVDYPKYIFRSRNGYYLNKSAKVCVL